MRLYNFDSLKTVCAFLVVLIHVYTPWQNYILPITRCAVPCFFMISGFFIFSEDKVKLEARLIKSMKRIFIVELWSTALFALVKLLFAFRYNDFSFLNLRTLVNFLLFNENPFGFHLWYIGAYLYTLLIVLFCSKLNLLKFLIVISPFLLLVDLIFGKYSLLIWNREFPVIYLRNFLFVGIPYFIIGMLIKHFKDSIINYTNIDRLALFGILLFSFTSIVEHIVLENIGMNSYRDHYISSTFLAISLFIFVMCTKQSKPSVISKVGENDSLYIYIIHPLFIVFSHYIIRYLPNLIQTVYLYLSPFVIFISTIIFIALLRKFHLVRQAL